MRIVLLGVLASAVLTRECGMPIGECAQFCGPRPIKSFTLAGPSSSAVCECEEYVPCIIFPKEVEK